MVSSVRVSSRSALRDERASARAKAFHEQIAREAKDFWTELGYQTAACNL